MAYLEYLFGTDTWSRVRNLILLACLYPLALWLYNLLFHPLAKYPGPLLWRASRLPYMRAVWSGRFPYIIKQLHSRYGDVVRVAPNELSFAHPTAWDDIYSNRAGANSEAFRKSELWHGNPDGGATSVFLTTDPKAHARVRRLMDPAFSERAVALQEGIVQGYVELCVEKLRSRFSGNQGKTTVNIVDWFNFTLFDIVGDLAYGESFGCLEKCVYEDWQTNMNRTIKLHYLTIHLRYYPKIVTLLLAPLMYFLIPKGLIEQFKDYHQRSIAKLDKRLSAKSKIDRPDIVSQLLRSDDGREDGLTRDEVTVNCMLFINAASETSATTLTAVANNLMKYPESLRTLEKEVRQFSDSSDITLQALKQLPYLNAVIKEALRMCNPNPIGHMRISPPQGGIVSGDYVPGNTFVTIQPLALSYSPQNFHDPSTWHPERWLPEAETNPLSPFHNDARKAVRGFGWGPSNCVGEPLAWAMLRLTLAKMVWNFDLRRAEDSPHQVVEWERQEVFAVFNKHRLDVTFAERRF